MAEEVLREKYYERMTFGRKLLLSAFTFCDRTNILEILEKIKATYFTNKTETDYLMKYYRGRQPILQREKPVRPEINNKIVVNRANEIVAFKTGYLLGEPIQYISKNPDLNVEDLRVFNSYMEYENKEAIDKQLANDMSICGTSYRMVLPANKDIEESPFNVYRLDPRFTFVVYSTEIGNKPLLGALCTLIRVVETKPNGRKETKAKYRYSVYTENCFFEIIDGAIVREVPHSLGHIPIIEYPNNEARLGDFEKVIPLLNAINKVQSNRVDGVEQFIQSLMVLKNVDIDETTFKSLIDLGAIKIKTNGTIEADIKFLTQEMNQDQVQTLIDDLYQTVLTLCGMPNRNGGTSTSDTGTAVIMRDGWSDAEARAKDTELIFKGSERKFLQIALKCAREINHIDIKLRDIEIKFTRKNYENIVQKTQVLTQLLSCDKVAPELAFAYCGLFSDPTSAYKESQEYIKSQEEKQAKINPNSKQNEDSPNGGDVE